MTKDEALKLIKIHDETGNIEDLVVAYNACKEALEQPAQEPVKKMYQSEHSEQWWKHEIDNARVDGYLKGRASGLKEAHPHQWVGLTDDEIDKIDKSINGCIPLESAKTLFAHAIEQKLKEKNTS